VNTFLFVLGRNPTLSRLEIAPFCDEILYDPEKSLLLAQNLVFENPRNLPKTKEQIFLERLGGIIRFGEVLGEFESEKNLLETIIQTVQREKSEGKIHLGMSAWGCGKNFLRQNLSEVKTLFRNTFDRNCRIVNISGKNLSSGKIFGEKLLKNGFEFLIWKRKNSFLLAKTVANQNVRNYTLRDEGKPFRDARMGMLPPKLAQILINIAHPKWEEKVIDPFCGSGTINIEAAIMGFQTIGTDIDPKRVFESRENFNHLATKFRYGEKSGEFFAKNVTDFSLEKSAGIIATEGFLGDVFEKYATERKIQAEGEKVLNLWEKIISHLGKSEIHTLSFCLPSWRYKEKVHSISEKLFAKIEQSSYIPSALFGGKRTYLYSRPESFVGREICVLTKKS
jgi:tRNA (guanine10-N2)-dimethyltransferase